MNDIYNIIGAKLDCFFRKLKPSKPTLKCKNSLTGHLNAVFNRSLTRITVKESASRITYQFIGCKFFVNTWLLACYEVVNHMVSH